MAIGTYRVKVFDGIKGVRFSDSCERDQMARVNEILGNFATGPRLTRNAWGVPAAESNPIKGRRTRGGGRQPPNAPPPPHGAA